METNYTYSRPMFSQDYTAVTLYTFVLRYLDLASVGLLSILTELWHAVA